MGSLSLYIDWYMERLLLKQSTLLVHQIVQVLKLERNNTVYHAPHRERIELVPFLASFVLAYV